MNCRYCGERVTNPGLTPDICWCCRSGVPWGPPFTSGEVGYVIHVPDFWPAGPLRSKEQADHLAKLWGGRVEELVPVAPEVHAVGSDLVTVE